MSQNKPMGETGGRGSNGKRPEPPPPTTPPPTTAGVLAVKMGLRSGNT